jgi:acyl-CoA thioesterase-1
LRRSPVRYVALGDSYTIGTSVREEERWPNRLVEALRDSVPLELVANLAVNGYSSADLSRFALPVLADLQPGFVSVLVGVNDVVRGVPLDVYRANSVQILDSVLRHVPSDRIAVVATPDYTRTPQGADFGDPRQQRAAIASINELMRQLCTERGIAFVDITPIADQAERDRSLVASDGLHPSAAQYRHWVDLVAPVVASLLGVKDLAR